MKKLISNVAMLCLLLGGMPAKARDDIFKAIRDNDLEALAKLARTDQIRAVEGRFRNPPLITAIIECNPKAVKVLMENGADIMQCDGTMISAWGCIKGLYLVSDEEQVRKKIEQMRADGDSEEHIRQFGPQLPQQYVGKEKEIKEIYTYLKSIVEGRQAALFSAIESGDRAEVLRLSRLTPLNEFGPGDRTPLMLAALRADMESVRMLLEAGANNAVGNPDVLRQLDIILATNKSRPPADGKAMPDAPPVGKWELDWYNGVLPFIGGTPLPERLKQYKDIRRFIWNFKGESAPPLLEAILRGDAKAARKHAKGANLEKPLREGMTPLCLAALEGNLNVVEALVGAGARLDTKMSLGGKKDLTVVEVLEEACAALEREDDMEREYLRKNGMTDKEIDKYNAERKKVSDMRAREKAAKMKKLKAVQEYLRRKGGR